MVRALDDSIGRIINTFEKRKLLDDTIIYFTTDNGGDPDWGGNNWPYRGTKHTQWEGGIKAIGSIRIPGVLPGQRKQMFHVSDIMPTISSLINCPIRGIKLDGIDQSKSLINNKSVRTEFLINIDPINVNTESADDRKWNSTFDVRVEAGLRWNEWKLVTGYPGDSDKHIYPPEWTTKLKFEADWKQLVGLFNIEDDPFELIDLSNERKDIGNC